MEPTRIVTSGMAGSFWSFPNSCRSRLAGLKVVVRMSGVAERHPTEGLQSPSLEQALRPHAVESAQGDLLGGSSLGWSGRGGKEFRKHDAARVEAHFQLILSRWASAESPTCELLGHRSRIFSAARATCLLVMSCNAGL